MSRSDAHPLELAVQRLAAQVAADPHLHAELLRARRQFFGVETGTRLPGAGDAAELRFQEWFGLERDSETLGAVPAELPAFAALVAELEGSVVGVFLVQSCSPRGVDVRDLQDDAVLDLVVPEGSLRPGDLLVGRLFPRGSGRYTPSTAAAVFRPGKEIGEAFRRDVARLELDRRLQQIELEHLLLRRPDQAPSPTAAARPAAGAAPASAPAPAVPLERLEAELDRLLRAGGSDLQVAELSQRLADAARPGPVMGPALDQIAFDSTVDLDRARELLLQIWNAFHPETMPETEAAPPAMPPGETLGERLVRTLDDGLRQHRDVDEVFAELERLAGLEPGAADSEDNPFDREEADDEAGAGTDPGGDLGPLVQEYLWETGAGDGPAAAVLGTWVELQGNAPVPNVDVERVTGADLVRLLLHVYLGAAPTERARAVREAHAVLQQFYTWAERTLEQPLGAALQECHGSLLEQLDRLAEAGIALSTRGPSRRTPGVLQVEDVGPAGFGIVDDGGQHHWLQVPGGTAALLRAGDLVLGALEPAGKGVAFAGMVVVLPRDARAAME